MDAGRLRQIIAEWHGRLAGVSEQDATQVVGSRWTRKQLLGHLIDSTANNHQRLVRLQQGHLAGFPGYDQEHWVEAGDYNRSAWDDLVGLWRLYSLQLAVVIEHIQPDCAGNRWEGHDADLGFLVEDFTRHMLHHLERIL